MSLFQSPALNTETPNMTLFILSTFSIQTHHHSTQRAHKCEMPLAVFLTVFIFWWILFSRTNHLPVCCWLVGLRCVNGSAHMAAACFRANLLNLMDSEKAFGLHVLALPTPCFLSFFLSLCLRLSLSAYWLSELPPNTRMYLLSSACLRGWLLEVLQHSPNRSDP